MQIGAFLKTYKKYSYMKNFEFILCLHVAGNDILPPFVARY